MSKKCKCQCQCCRPSQGGTYPSWSEVMNRLERLNIERVLDRAITLDDKAFAIYDAGLNPNTRYSDLTMENADIKSLMYHSTTVVQESSVRRWRKQL